MEGFRGFINPCHISVEEEYTFLIRPFLVSRPLHALDTTVLTILLALPFFKLLQDETGLLSGWVSFHSSLDTSKVNFRFFVPKVTMTANEFFFFFTKVSVIWKPPSPSGSTILNLRESRSFGSVVWKHPRSVIFRAVAPVWAYFSTSLRTRSTLNPRYSGILPSTSLSGTHGQTDIKRRSTNVR